MAATGSSCSRAMTACPSRAKVLACKAENRASSPMSAPATKALSPAPVSTTTRMSSSAATRPSASASSASSARLIAFSALGRLKVIVAMPCSAWNSNVS